METATMKLVLSPSYSKQSSLAYYINLQRTAVEKWPKRYNREMMRKATIVSELLVTIVCRASKDVNFGVDSDKAKSRSRWGFRILKIVSWAKPRSSFDEFGWIKSTRGCRSEVGRILFGEIMCRDCSIRLKSTKIRKKIAFDIRGVWDTRQICINCIQSRQLSRHIRQIWRKILPHKYSFVCFTCKRYAITFQEAHHGSDCSSIANSNEAGKG